jgi:hypothetical protein
MLAASGRRAVESVGKLGGRREVRNMVGVELDNLGAAGLLEHSTLQRRRDRAVALAEHVATGDVEGAASAYRASRRRRSTNRSAEPANSTAVMTSQRPK